MVKRFIAGATCPSCGIQDSIRADHDDAGGMLSRECVECGFKDVLSSQSQKELETRVTALDPRANIEAQPVKIMDPSKLH